MAKDLYELNDDADEQPARSTPAPKAKPDVDRSSDDFETYDLEMEQIEIEPRKSSRRKRHETASVAPVERNDADDVEPGASPAAAEDAPAAASTRRLIFPDVEKFCIHCGGKMRDLTEPQCPHCHAPFAVGDPKSFSDEPVVGRRDMTEPVKGRLIWIGVVFVVGWLISFFVLYGIPIFGPTPLFVIWVPVLVYLAMPLFPEYWTDSLAGHIAVGAAVGGVAGLTLGPDFTLLFGILMGAFTGLVRRNMTMM